MHKLPAPEMLLDELFAFFNEKVRFPATASVIALLATVQRG
jgi:hypothetical protein